MSIIEKLDSNFSVPHSVKKEGAVYHNVLNGKFGIYGVFYKDGCFRRMPFSAAERVSEGVLSEHTHTAGGRIKFITSSPYVIIRALMHNVCRMPHFAFTGSCGFDLYISENGEKPHYYKSFVPPLDIKKGYEGIIEFPSAREREITINMPLYSGVRDLSIGLSSDAVLKIPGGYRDFKPFLYYGSSITQGGCASRPGNSCQSIIEREFNIDYVNLGFSGNAKGEDRMADYIKNLPMSLFIYDYDYNAPTPAHLRVTHERMFLRIREKNPCLPVIMLSAPNFNQTEDSIKRTEIIKSTYENALKAGDRNVYFIEGKALMNKALSDGTVDNCHPNDLGFYSMAENLIPVISEIIK